MLVEALLTRICCIPTKPASAPETRNSFIWTDPMPIPPAWADPAEAPTARASYPSRIRFTTNHTIAAASTASGNSHERRGAGP